MTGSGESVLVIDKSALAFTLVGSVSLLLVLTGSAVVLVTVAVFVRIVPWFTLVATTPRISTAKLWPEGRVPLSYTEFQVDQDDPPFREY